jgi:hypothetical protein
MIKLSKPIASKWTGSGDGEPVKITVDIFKVLRVDHDVNAKVLSFAGAYGYLDASGNFNLHAEPGGAINLVSAILAQGEEYDKFQSKTSALGAPPEDFRIADVEALIIEKGLISKELLEPAAVTSANG